MRSTVTTEKVTCDICGREVPCLRVDYPVVFTSEQTEGRPCKPYVQQTSLDLCPDCAAMSLRVNAYGAQGFNTYQGCVFLPGDFQAMIDQRGDGR